MVLRKAFTLLELLIVIGIIAVLAAILVPNFVRARSRGQLTACKSNLKNIGTALEMYSTDNAGYYPGHISLLTPKYLKTIPTCPSTGQHTYQFGFQTANHVSEKGLTSALYTIVCAGSNHQGAGISTAHYPQYTSVRGLIERP